MTGQRRWRNTFSRGHSIDVTCLGEEGRDGIDGGRIEFGLTLAAEDADGELDGVATTGVSDGVSVRHERESNREFVVSVPDGAGVVRVYVRFDGQRHPVYLPGPTLLENCADAIDGDAGAAGAVLAEFAAPPQVPAVCGAFLTVPEVGKLVETLARANGYAKSRLHSYRYALVRGAIASPTGLSVESAEELEALVETLDEAEGIRSVRLVDALADAMATVLASPDATRATLDELGYELATVERYDDLFFACYLAQLVLADGIRAAEGHAMARRWHLDGDYERRKARAKNAPYRDRGRAWRELLCPAARQSLDEFAYTLANALYWSGEVSRTDSRMGELLLEAADVVASTIGLTQVEGRARYERLLSRGHRLRSQNCYAMAGVAFDRAADVAAEYGFLPEWEPVYNGATVRSAELGTAGDHERAIAVLDDALQRLFEYDVPPAKLNHVVHHLKGQKLEAKATLADFGGDGDDPVSLLREARTHYEVIGLDRSRARTHQKLQHAKRRAPAVEAGNSSAPETASGEQTEATTETEPSGSDEKRGRETPEPAETPKRETTGRGGRRRRRTGGHVRSEHARTEFEPNPELNDFLTPPDPDEVGSADLMTSPENRNDDPFAETESPWGDEGRTDLGGYPE